MLHPYMLDPIMQLTVRLSPYPQPHGAIGRVKGSDLGGTRQTQIGNVQAWYYHEDQMLVLWECFLGHPFRDKPMREDENMHQLWTSVERFLLSQFPKTNLRSRGYSPVAKAAYGKTV
jgi:hypothetical protein